MSAPATFAQKALARSAGRDVSVAGDLEPGTLLTVRPHVVLSHDNSAAIREIWLRFEQERVVIPERIAITLDHAVPAPTPAHAENHRIIRDFVAEQGIANFHDVGRGICHQVHSEEAAVLPGQLILGADSHTPHFGWLGAFGAGVGRSEVAVLWATGELWLQVPETIRLVLEGSLGSDVTAKDVALHLISHLGADFANYRCVELSGEAVEALSLDGRAALANMMAEMGAKASFVAPDEAVRRFVARRLARRLGVTEAAALQRVEESVLLSDSEAEVERTVTLSASEIEPVVARPPRVDDAVPVSELREVTVDQAFVGTCTNGRLEDLRAVRDVVAGRRVARGTRFLVVPASSEVLAEATRRGWIGEILAAGVHLGTPGCGPCMGNHLGVLAAGEVCISSANRNFRGRMGNPESEVYLASPAVVAASAVAGRIVSPRELERDPQERHEDGQAVAS
ncbi:MAG: aconitase/3-isopropylmalate dehydratase large subunit family protein [Acidobacteriota bacterium]